MIAFQALVQVEYVAVFALNALDISLALFGIRVGVLEAQTDDDFLSRTSQNRREMRVL